MPSDWKHTRWMSALKAPRHYLKEFLHRRPSAEFRWKFTEHPQIGGYMQCLARDGMVVLERHFNGDRLRRLQLALAPTLATKVDYGQVSPDSEASQDFLHVSPVLLDAALDDTLLEIIARYYGKPFALGRADATRLYPSSASRTSSYSWHHDGRGRQVKAMILLTDVPADGTRMTYLKGSHRRYHSYFRTRGTGTQFETDVRDHPEWHAHIAAFTGPAGTVALFDTNGLHSGNRTLVAGRDTYTFYYPSGANFKPQHVARAQFEALPPEKRRVLTGNPLLQVV